MKVWRYSSKKLSHFMEVAECGVTLVSVYAVFDHRIKMVFSFTLYFCAIMVKMVEIGQIQSWLLGLDPITLLCMISSRWHPTKTWSVVTEHTNYEGARGQTQTMNTYRCKMVTEVSEVNHMHLSYTCCHQPLKKKETTRYHMCNAYIVSLSTSRLTLLDH